MLLGEHDIEVVKQALSGGVLALKLGRHGKPHFRRFTLNGGSEPSIQWKSRRKTARQSRIYLKNVIQVQV